MKEKLLESLEEMQTTLEELHASNEALASTNEQLQAANQALSGRADELAGAKAMLESVLCSMPAAAIALDRNLAVLVWNQRAEELWGLRPDEARGSPVLELDIGLPVGELDAPIRACLQQAAGHRALMLDGLNRRGEPVRYRVVCAPLVPATSAPLISAPGTPQGVVLLIEESP